MRLLIRTVPTFFLMTKTIVALSTGTKLEIDLEMPSGVTELDADKGLAICLHPWSFLGGRMGDPVLSLVANVLHSHKFHVLRYNSRGVGNSSGWPTLSGSGERQDLEALVSWALQSIHGVSKVLFFASIFNCMTIHPH
jgi:alpha/beta superfamily hydrolase